MTRIFHVLSGGRAVRNAWLGWAALLLVTTALIAAGSERTAIGPYRSAALGWLAGGTLYEGTGVGGFVYFPQAAILFIPFAMLPYLVSEALWRLAMIGTFAAGIRSFARLAGERSETELFPLMTLVSLPLAWDCARNGQATLAMTGMMLLAVVDIARRKWWRAALWLSLGVAVKPLAIVLALLAMAVYRPLGWRVLLGLVAVALSPFLTQRPDYVLQQYAACLGNMTTAAHVGVVSTGWTTPFTALREAGIDVPERVQTIIRILAAFGTLALCFGARRRHDAADAVIYLFSLAVVYLMLFSPRTENNTYAMLGPAIAVFLARAFLVESRFVAGTFLAGNCIRHCRQPLFRTLAGPSGGECLDVPAHGDLFCLVPAFQAFHG